MRFVVTHPGHPSSGGEDLSTGDGLTAVARAAEVAGFDALGVTDHPAPSRRWLDAGGHDAIDPFVALAHVAAVTSRLRLVTNLLVLPYRHPFVVAKAAATLDRLSGGRFTLAVGVGYLRDEFTALGIDFDRRAAITDEALQVIRGVWTDDDFVHDGDLVRTRGVTARPRPSPPVPIWVGGNSGAARRRAVEHGDGWCPFVAPAGLARATRTAMMDAGDTLAAGVADLRRRCDEAGRDPASIDIVVHGLTPPGRETASADRFLAETDRLTALGVGTIGVTLPGRSLSETLEAVDDFGSRVITATRAGQTVR